jgi:dihydroorotate dehydrogenase (fumarate)
VDLRTKYLGIDLKNPIVFSLEGATAMEGTTVCSLDYMKELEDAGAAAIVTVPVFQEELTNEDDELNNVFFDVLDATKYLTNPITYKYGPEKCLDLITEAKHSLSIPIIGSLNGTMLGSWLEFAKKIEDAGADALELTIYYMPTDISFLNNDIEKKYIEVLATIKQLIRIPVAMKLTPYFSSLSNFAWKLVNAGADGLVLFNGFYRDIHFKNLKLDTDYRSTSEDIRLSLNWTALLSTKLQCSFVASSGIHSATDVIKMIMSGSDVAILSSAIVKNEPKVIKTILKDLTNWMSENNYTSIKEMKGKMVQEIITNYKIK